MTMTSYATGIVLAAAGSAQASFSVAADPSTWPNVQSIAQLDQGGPNNGFSYTAGAGFSSEFLGSEVDETGFESEVFRFTSADTITTSAGTFNVAAGDLVFTYRMDVVGAASDTVRAINQVQITGAPLFGFGQDPLSLPLVTGIGWVDPLAGVGIPTGTNTNDAGEFGASVDWEWDSEAAVLNDQSFTMLLFTRPALIGEGVANLFAPPGQPGGLTGNAQADEAPPVLIPLIPSPGAAALAAVGLMAATRRRRV